MKSLPLFLAAGLLSLCTALPVKATEQPQHWTADQVRPLTPARIASLPADQQAPWLAYLETSKSLAAKLPPENTPDFIPDKPVVAVPHKGATVSKGLLLKEKPEWYASAAARDLADHVALLQNPAGGWSKGNNYNESGPQSRAERSLWDNGTFDNDATTTELEFLGLVISKEGDDARASVWKKSFERGMAYVFAAQYPNGGFPQVFPLGGNYHDAITFNDDAMLNVLVLLARVGSGKDAFSFVPDALRKEADLRLRRGVACVLACQIHEAGGRITAWNQQHDPLTLQPCPGRNFEPIACCAEESCDLAGFLMSLPKPSPEVVAAVDHSIAWLKGVSLQGFTWKSKINDGKPQDQPGAGPLWARFYELGTDKPIFGDRDRSIHYSVTEVSEERRKGYAWYGPWPAAVIARYNEWKKTH